MGYQCATNVYLAYHMNKYGLKQPIHWVGFAYWIIKTLYLVYWDGLSDYSINFITLLINTCGRLSGYSAYKPIFVVIVMLK